VRQGSGLRGHRDFPHVAYLAALDRTWGPHGGPFTASAHPVEEERAGEAAWRGLVGAQTEHSATSQTRQATGAHEVRPQQGRPGAERGLAAATEGEYNPAVQRKRFLDWRIVAFALATCLASATRASAQSEAERDTARAAADAGRAAYDAGRHDEAIRLFTAAESIVHAPPHLLYLARANEKLGRLAASLAIYQQLVREPLPEGAPAPFTDAQKTGAQELDALIVRVPMIQIRVEGGAPEARVRVDGESVDGSVLTSPLPLDPGTHVVEASADGWDTQRSSVVLEEGQRQTVVLALSRREGATSVVPEAPRPARQRPPSPVGLDRGTSAEPSGQDWARMGGYAALGVGALGATVAVFSGIAHYRTDRDADAIVDACRPDASCTVSEMKAVSRLDARSADYGTLAWVAGAVGALGIGSGAVLLTLDSWDGGWLSPSPRRTQVRPWIGVASAGVRGRF
jgi:hypothetical protein